GGELRARLGLGALAGWLAVVAPWAVRNLAHFRAPHLFVVGLDRSARPDAARGALPRWMSPWARHAHDLSTYEYCLNPATPCLLDPFAFPPEAFDPPRQRERADELFTLHRARSDEERVARGFAQLASERRRRPPWHTLVALPLARAVT